MVLGAYNLSITESETVSIGVENIFIHKDWNLTSHGYDADIAILVLKNHVTFNRYIQPICLIKPSSRNLLDITKGFPVGFGYDEDDELKNVLKYAEVE